MLCIIPKHHEVGLEAQLTFFTGSSRYCIPVPVSTTGKRFIKDFFYTSNVILVYPTTMNSALKQRSTFFTEVHFLRYTLVTVPINYNSKVFHQRLPLYQLRCCSTKHHESCFEAKLKLHHKVGCPQILT